MYNYQANSTEEIINDVLISMIRCSIYLMYLMRYVNIFYYLLRKFKMHLCSFCKFIKMQIYNYRHEIDLLSIVAF